MIEIDGGIGGGQVFRSALSLSVATATPVRITDIRGGRPTPGLRPQHLAAVELLAEISAADVTGARPGSNTVEFIPGELTPGSYAIDIETAGSTLLLCDAVLPLATDLPGHLTVRASGGTDVKWAPTIPHYTQVKLPLLRAHGIPATLEVDRHGFYPVGGGTVTLRLAPGSPTPFDLGPRSAIEGCQIFSVAAFDLEDASVADRQAAEASRRMASNDIELTRRETAYVSAPSPGSAIAITLRSDAAIAGFDAIGERGVPSEAVATRAIDRLEKFLESDAALDAHTGDQLLTLLARFGGAITVPRLTEHMRTHIQLLEAFDLTLSTTHRDGVVHVSRA